MDAVRLYSLLERVGNLLRAELRASASAHGLPLIQLEALHYLSMCNRYSDTPAAVAAFFGATKGTTSQTLSSLVDKGLVEKRPDGADARVVHCRLTARGRAVVRDTLPPRLLAGAATAAGSPELEAGLSALLRSLQQSRGHAFGVCAGCTYFTREKRGFRCGLTQESLTRADSQKLCREHIPADQPAESTP